MKLIGYHIDKNKPNREKIRMLRMAEESERKIKALLKQQEEEIIRRRYKLTPMGPLIWPIIGPVSSVFGMRMHPIFGVNRLHTGIDIDADYGVPIKSVNREVMLHFLGGWEDMVILYNPTRR